MKNVSELRQDLVTGDWVVVATGRAKRSNAFRRLKPEKPQSKSSCPFERLLPTALLVYDHRGEPLRLNGRSRKYLAGQWWLQVIPNKYPAFRPGVPGVCPVIERAGPYGWQEGVGFHEVVITRDHIRSIADMTRPEAEIIIRSYRDRYLALKDEECVKYISIFHNHGRLAGATVSHPHSQIIAIPVIPPDVGRSLRGSAKYFRRHRRCVHCTMLAFERKTKKRIVYENRDYLVFCPYVSRQAFEVRIFPKRHSPEFESMGEGEIIQAADALKTALAKLSRGLNKPAYNFFVHTAPTAGGKRLRYYHWHIEIVPKTAVWAGFEIGTGIEISTIAPETAARFLWEIRV